jgi:hypothetical protein
MEKHYLKSSQIKLKRQRFTPEEDFKLIQLVHFYGVLQMKKISTFLPGRSERQCQDRWRGYLAPYILNQQWTLEEDMLLIQKVKEYGKKWTKLSFLFPGRSDISLKNRFHKLMNGKSQQTVIISSNTAHHKLNSSILEEIEFKDKLNFR